MIRHSPCERYLKYLLVHPDRYSKEAIRDIVRGQQLDYIGDVYLERLRSKLRVPVPFYPNKRTHQASKAFIDRHKLVGFFLPDAHAIAAHDLLQRPKAKELIETLVMAGDSPQIVVTRLRSIGLHVHPRAIKRYCDYYWNLDLVDSSELRAILRIRVEYPKYRDDGRGLTPEQQMHLTLMSGKDQYRDPRRSMMDLYGSPIASMMNQLRMGLMPSNVEVARLARATHIAALGRTLLEMNSGRPNAAASARDFVTVAKMTQEILVETGSPDTELQKELQQLALATDEAGIPHIGELEGSFTTQVEPQTFEAVAEVKDDE